MTTADAGRAGDTRKPRDDEIDVYGLTHVGKVRKNNQDHFLLASIHKRIQLLQTSLSDQQRLPFGDERLAVIAMIADGVGGGEGGEKASATALEIATQYLVSSMNLYYSADSAEASFMDALQGAAMRCHDAVVARAKAEGVSRSMATTLTLWMGVWPWFYLLQVGDSRYYLYRGGQLTQVSRDQTLAQDLVDQGVFTRAVGERSRFAHVLSSAIGGEKTMPVVTRLRSEWNIVHLLCSDGLTKHVPDERIAERLAAMTSSRQVCEQLLEDTLEGGGTDNVTIVVGRAVPKEPGA
ncbi:MAG TPA: protein phosphatase 2C domain-containing protein [Gemmatimonadales bacterium]|nr:protein phosphatase 2C domain-containing protein [Gemmatimonadales bacterium]